jgi:hypothetical protein
MSTPPHRPLTAPRTKRTALAVAGVMAAGLIPALAATGTAAAAPRAGRQQVRVTAGGVQLSLRVPASDGAPGYRLDIPALAVPTHDRARRSHRAGDH